MVDLNVCVLRDTREQIVTVSYRNGFKVIELGSCKDQSDSCTWEIWMNITRVLLHAGLMDEPLAEI